MDRGAWWAAVHRVAQSLTRLKQLSSSSSSRGKYMSTVSSVDWGKNTQCESREPCFFVDKPEDDSPGCSLSGSSEVLLHRGKAGARMGRSFCNKHQAVGTSEDYCEFKKSKHLKLRNLSTFLCMGSCKSLGSLKSSL